MTVVQTPEDMLRAITADAEIERVAWRVVFRPGVLALHLPSLRDGVAKKNNLGLALAILDALAEFEETIGAALVGAWGRHDAAIDGGRQIGLANRYRTTNDNDCEPTP